MRLVTTLVATITLMVLLSGCGDNAAPSTAERTQVVRVSSLAVPNTPWHDMWLRFGERFEAQMSADMKLDLFITGRATRPNPDQRVLAPGAGDGGAGAQRAAGALSF